MLRVFCNSGPTTFKSIDHQTTTPQAARRLLRKPEEVPSEGLAALVEATARLGNTSGVLKLLAMMREVGDAPPAALYESLLKLANTRFYWDMALALLRDAEADAVPLTGAMLCATLHCCLQADVRIFRRSGRLLFADEQGI